MVCKQDASKRLFEMKELEPEPESPFLDEAAYDMPSRGEAWDSYEAEPELQSETPFASALVPAGEEDSGLAAEEGLEGEIEPEALEDLEVPGHEREEETGEEEGELEGGDVRPSHPFHAKTWAGEFIVDEYVRTEVGDRVVAGYGVDIKMRFKPNKYVDAHKIAFVQTAQSIKDGKPYNKWDKGNEQKVAESRMIPAFKPGEGTHIDQMPSSRTPLYGMKDSRGNALSYPQPNAIYTDIGWYYIDQHGNLQQHDAKLYDSADLSSGDNFTAADAVMKQEWHQIFETAALAIDGSHRGIFYGSIEWGWKKSKYDVRAQKIPLKIKSKDFPSPIFMEAGKLWNASVTSKNEETIDLPIGVPTTYKKITPLWDSPDERKKVADLVRDTRLGRLQIFGPQQREGLTNVIVVSGTHTGKKGWVREVDLF